MTLGSTWLPAIFRSALEERTLLSCLKLWPAAEHFEKGSVVRDISSLSWLDICYHDDLRASLDFKNAVVSCNDAVLASNGNFIPFWISVMYFSRPKLFIRKCKHSSNTIATRIANRKEIWIDWFLFLYNYGLSEKCSSNTFLLFNWKVCIFGPKRGLPNCKNFKRAPPVLDSTLYTV